MIAPGAPDDQARVAARRKPKLPVVQLRGVAKAYGNTRALDGIDLEIRPGEVLGLAGPNGAGKSTLVKILAGEELEDSGDVRLAGDAWDVHARWRDVAVVHQEPHVFPTLSVAENLLVGREGGRIARPRIGARETRVLEDLRLTREAKRPIEGCSLVVRQFVEIGRAVLRDAAVFLFDEPNSALTLEESEWLFRYVERLRELAQCAIVLVSHRLGDLVAQCDRVVVIRDGRCRVAFEGAALTTTALAEALVAGADDGSADTGRPRPGWATAEHPAVGGERVLRVTNWSDSAGDLFTGVDLEVCAGEILVLTGPEGGGGRELLRSLAGLRRARGARTGGESASGSSGYPKVAYVAGDRRMALFGNLSVAGNLTARLGRDDIATRIGVLQRRRVAGAAAELAHRLQVRAESPRHRIGVLSGGNQQKVSVAAALASRPRVLLLEEPTRGVDVATKREIYALLRGYADEGNAVVTFSPEIEEAFMLGDVARVVGVHGLGAPINRRDIQSLEDLARRVDAATHGYHDFDR